MYLGALAKLKAEFWLLLVSFFFYMKVNFCLYPQLEQVHVFFSCVLSKLKVVLK